MSTIGAYIMAISLITVLLNWLHGAEMGQESPGQSVGRQHAGMACPSPPPHDNFATPPVADDPYNLSDWEYDPSIEGWVPRDTARRGRRRAADRTRPVTH